MSKQPVFTSFDFDHDEDLRNLLIGQSKNPDSPFEMSDWSIKEPLTGDWKEKVRKRINKCNLMIVICSEYTGSASGVSSEVKMAQEEEMPYFLLWGRSDINCVKPQSARGNDKIYKWTWDNLKNLIAGAR
ncbi:MAG: hypothetical protein WC566_02460 [Dehalococcoidia bacterium]